MAGEHAEGLEKIMDVQSANEREGPTEPLREETIKKFALAPKYAPQPEKRGTPSNLPLLLSVLAVVISLLALGLALFYHPSSALSPVELKAVAEDLKTLRDSNFEVQDSFGTTYSVSTEIPLAEAMDTNFQVPIEMDLPVSGTVVGTSPWGSTVSIPVSGTIPVRLVANMTLIDTTQTIRISAQVPGNVSASFAVKPSEAWKNKLDDIIKRLGG
jgi:hypothetical protein